jgi:hypothetical protein
MGQLILFEMSPPPPEPCESPAAPIGTVHHGTNAELIRHVSRLYIPDGAMVADVTYGRGVFWKQADTSRFTLLASDLVTCPDRPYDFRSLPYEAESLGVVVLDPPYQHTPGRTLVDRQYQNAATTKGLYHADIIRLYRDGMTEAVRVLTPNGGLLFVKCQDEVQSGEQCWSHLELYHEAMTLGLLARDLFILVPHAKPGQTRWARQLHARRNHSYLWIFTKGLLKTPREPHTLIRQCRWCDRAFPAQRQSAEYCRSAHKQAAYRERLVTLSRYVIADVSVTDIDVS